MSTADHAKALLKEVAARYASITSYSDCGAVHTQLIENDRMFTTMFSTLYKKPSLYRFEFERPHPYPPLQNIITRNAVVFDGSTAYTWKQTAPMIRRPNSRKAFHSQLQLRPASPRDPPLALGDC